MGDIICAKCGEPWDSYGVYNGDMEDWEKEAFLKGNGCPSCGFGHYKEKVIGEHEEDFMRSALEETDDPDSVLNRW